MRDEGRRPASLKRQSATPVYVLPETTALALIGGVDLLSTVYLIATGQATEANPLMSGLLHRLGPTGLITAKALLLAIPLAVAEMARRRRPQFVRAALRVGIAAYLFLWVYAMARLWMQVG